MSVLAIKGGKKVREKNFPSQINFDEREQIAVNRVMQYGRLSGYRGSHSPEFYGGREVRALETEWCAEFGSKHAIATTSATMALFIALKAADVIDGDEVIVTPWSMSCSATLPAWFGALPVFADIDQHTYCLDPDSVGHRLSAWTKAIIAVDLFGHPYDERIDQLARERGLIVIEDAAQALGARRGEAYAGRLGHIGVYSFNFGKHLTCGEGGMIVTDDDDLAMRCRLVMNHAESVVNDMPAHEVTSELAGMLGLNLRMTEISAAIMRVQLQKRRMLEDWRCNNALLLEELLDDIPGILPRVDAVNCSHTFYVQAFEWNSASAEGIHRDMFIEAVKAELSELDLRDGEGVPMGCGYVKPIYLMPYFQQGQDHASYARGSCPVAEHLWKDSLFLHRFLAYPTTALDVEDVSSAFHKVWEYRDELR